MTTYDGKAAISHDDVLEEMADALDIPPSRFDEAKSRYESIGNWLDRPESALAPFGPTISPQGSFLLGTVTRPFTDSDEFDIDLVCLLQASKTDFTQKSLKDAVGREVVSYAKISNMIKPPEEGRRCWTLKYADGVQFHMDILPALPDAQYYQDMLVERGFWALARNSSLTGPAIAVTDKTVPHYDRLTDDWPQSNPQGYAMWFRSRMQIQLNKRKVSYVKHQDITASVDDIPDYRVKTPLQRAIQLLKRHRDCMFAADGTHKPISIVITTLSANSYNEEPTISQALQNILTNMDRFIEDRFDVAWIANPVNPAENFADKWEEEPAKRDNFFRWLTQARHDFAMYLRASPFYELPATLRANLGTHLVDRALGAIRPAAGLAALAVADAADSGDSRRAEAAIEQINRVGPQSRPWAKM